MPYKKKNCPLCGNKMDGRSKTCRPCSTPYERTEKHRQEMSSRLAGILKPHLKGRERPEHSELMKKWWTPERRETKRQEMLKRNPDSTYHGLSSKSKKRMVDSVGHCENPNCQDTGSRLGVHHKNRDKHDHSPSNLIVLCHRCHMQKHRYEIGWAAYRKKRSLTQDL